MPAKMIGTVVRPTVRLRLKSCPRCAGDVVMEPIISTSEVGEEQVCLQCGWRK